MNDYQDLLPVMSQALDGLGVGLCLFDKNDCCVHWNKSFLRLFPEHTGHVFIGEPYRENLKRFYLARLSPKELPDIEQYIEAGIQRHHQQLRPYTYMHHGQRIEVSSLPMKNGARLRVWRIKNTLEQTDHSIEADLPDGLPPYPNEAHSLIDQIPDGLMCCDANGLIKWVNAPFVAMYELGHQERAIGLTFEEVFSAVWADKKLDAASTYATSLAELRENLRCQGLPFDLRLPGERYIRMTASTTGYQDIFYAHVNISELKRKEKLLAHTQKELLNQAIMQSEQTEQQMLNCLNSIALTRDNETGNHIIRTQQYVKIIALRLQAMGLHTEELDEKSIELMFKAAPLHDVGKVGIPDMILKKQGKLTEEEWAIMKTHPEIGESALTAAIKHTDTNKNIISVAIEIAGGHHEKWDGSGYPRGLSGKKIPLAARIMSLADVYDALVSERAYKKGWSHNQAQDLIQDKKSTQFDPDVVDAFMHETEQFRAIAERFKD